MPFKPPNNNNIDLRRKKTGELTTTATATTEETTKFTKILTHSICLMDDRKCSSFLIFCFVWCVGVAFLLFFASLHTHTLTHAFIYRTSTYSLRHRVYFVWVLSFQSMHSVFSHSCFLHPSIPPSFLFIQSI